MNTQQTSERLEALAAKWRADEWVGVTLPGYAAQSCADDLDKLRASLPEPGVVSDGLCGRLQQKCSDWGTYWRASDAHGVNINIEQATDLLRDALGVEVEIAPAAKHAEAVAFMESEGWQWIDNGDRFIWFREPAAPAGEGEAVSEAVRLLNESGYHDAADALAAAAKGVA